MYFVNKKAQDNGDHEVHVATCNSLPSGINLLYLGEFATCTDAVMEAKRHYTKANGCFYCCKPCHTT